MISVQKKFLFIHVPKTGGNSIQNVLKDFSEDEIITTGGFQDGVERFGVVNKRYNVRKHSTLSEYKEAIEPELFEGLFKFSVVRNPWDRMVSLYFSPHRNVTEWNREDFMKLVAGEQPLRFYITYASFSQKLAADIGFLKRAGQGIDCQLDFLMRFEHLDEDFKKVCGKINIPNKPLVIRNRSEHEHYSRYYDEKSRLLVEEKFRDEIDFGGYKFEKSTI